MTNGLVRWVCGTSCCNEVWEDAYNRFESEEEEIRKFRRRLISLGAESWSKDARIVDLFCGSGRNLVCLERMGFSDLHGVDLSPRLLEKYEGHAQMYVGNATDLKFPDEWADFVIVQGGLHHLEHIKHDLGDCVREARRVLKTGGRFVVVEPWLTPMLRFVHWCCDRRLLCACWPKLEALSTMIREEKKTYFQWLKSGVTIRKIFAKNFSTVLCDAKFGKLRFVGEKSAAGAAADVHRGPVSPDTTQQVLGRAKEHQSK